MDEKVVVQPTGTEHAAESVDASASVKITRTYGGGGGGAFPAEYVRTIGLRSGRYVDALMLNGVRHGGSGGDNPEEIELGSDDYWTEFHVRSGEFIDYLGFKSASGQEVAGGGGGGGDMVVNHARVLRIAGKSGKYLDSISIEYIQNYQPSTFVTKAKGIFQLATSNEVISKFSSSSTNTVLAYSYSTTVFDQTEASASASVSGEFYALFSASTGFTHTDSTTTAISRQCTTTLNEAQGEAVKQTISDNEAGFLIGDINIMQSADGRYWMSPVGAASWVTLKTSEYSRLVGYYDFSGAAGAQTGLGTEQKYGFDYLTQPSA